MQRIDKDRFTGFASLYDAARPRPPPKVVEIILGYRGGRGIGRLLDLGSGTGLSTAIWQGYANEITGIEPTEDMRAFASSRYPELRFIDAHSYDTGMESASIDAVTCSQAFHWMEPESTLAEVARILVDGGVFAAYDCEWPVSWNWEAEKAYVELLGKAKEHMREYPETRESGSKYPKEGHLGSLERSGKFRYARQIVFDNVEPCDAERFVNIALSQGSLQSLIKRKAPGIEDLILAFTEACATKKESTMRVGYVMNIGIK